MEHLGSGARSAALAAGATLSSVPTVVIAPDSFKGTISARDAAAAIAEGWRSVRPDDELVLLPQADGGEGTLDAIEASVPGSVRRSAGQVTGPDGGPTPGEWLELPDGTAVVELAQSSGITLLPEPDPLGATTRGLGEVIRAALESGATSLVIGLGGSGSTDAAAGALAALGLALLDEGGEPVRDGGRGLVDIVEVRRRGLVPPPTGGVTLLTDVTAPLLGPTGAAAVFGPQKGATPEQVALLETGLAHLAALLGGDPGLAGTGAAGGAGYGFSAAWGAAIRSGADRIAELSCLPTAVARADIVLTGEGSFDAQSLGGKVVGRVLALAGSKAAVIAGRVAADPGVWAASLEQLAGSAGSAMADPARWLRAAGSKAAGELSPR